MSVMAWEMSWFLSVAAFIASSAFLWLLLMVVVYHLAVIMAEPQEGRRKKRRHRGNKWRARAFVLLESSQPSRTHCPIHPEMDGMYEIVHQFNRTFENLTRYLDTLNWEATEGSDSSWTSITPSDVGPSSSVSLSPSREDPDACITATEASSSTEVFLSPLSDDSWTSITESHVSSSSRESLPTLVDGEDMDQAPSIQPGQGHPHLDLEEQPGQPTHPPCAEEVASYLEAGSVQQHQQDLEIQLGAPSPPPEVPDVHSRETEMPVTHHKGQDTLEGLTPAAKLERELGLPADVDETPQDVPASAPPSTRRPEERDVMVVPIVQDLPFLAEAVKRQLERHIVKMKVQRRYGLPTTVLEYEKSFEDLVLGHKASQPPPPQRHTALPYRSPFQQWDRRVRTRKSPGQPPGPQEESADPLDTCPRGTRAPAHTGPAAFLGAAQEMPEEDEETPPYKRERGETACSSSTSVETLPGTHGKEQGPGTQGDVHSSSPSDQEERALPESEGAPREQSGQGSESPSTSYGDMGPPELLLEQSVPVGEADHSLEGQSSSSEELGTPELPSALAAPPRSSSPQTQAPSHDERPSALPPSPDSAGTALHIPCLEELLTEVTLSPLSDVSWTSITASHVSCSSQPSLPTLVDGEDMDQASSIQPGQGHPHLDLEEQPGQPTHPPCAEEVASYLEAGSVQQHQQDLEIQLGAPSPPPEVPDVHSRETEMPVTHHKGQDTLEGLTPAAKLERELGLPADVDETPQDVPASAPPSTRRPEERDVMVVPIVQDLPFLAEAVKRQLERHIVKMKIQRRYGLPTKVLEYEKSFEDLVLGHKASQPPPPQRHTGLPYRSPFQQWDRRVRTRKSPGQPPGPQEESADPLDTCPRGTRAPVHTGPAAFLGAAQEMPEEDEETPPYKRERGETACSSSASVETLPGTHGKEQGPGTQGDVHSSSPSDQEERALPESEGAPREQSGQGSESPSTSYGDMGPPELLLEQSVPVGEADHSLEGQSSSSEELGTPELPSALAAPPRSSSPQTQAPSHDERPSALPPSPDSAGTALHIPCLEELLTEVTLSPLSDVSWTSITASHVSCSSQPSLPTLVDGEDMDQASSIQPGQGHPHLDLEEQPGQPTHPPCAEEVASYLEAGSVQQHQQDLEIQLGAPSPPPEVPDVHSRETEMPVTHHKGQDTLEGLTPAAKLERELGLPADVDETPQDVPASAPPSTRRPEERDVMVVPIVQDLPFLAEAVKRQLERHIVKMKVQRRYGLPTTVLEYEKSFEDLVLGHKASQPPPPQRHTALPYRSPFQQWDRRVRTRKSPGQPPGPQEESADPLDTCPRGTRAPAHSGPAAFLGAAQEMPEEDEETPPYKRERGETACSSSASVETLPGTHGKEQGPGTQGDVHSSSPSDQEERALPESEGAPREQSGQGSESPSTSYGDMGPPELLLEQSVPVGEADHSLEGQSSSSEELGTPELPSALAAPPRSSSPQTQAPSHDERPSALPPSPDSAGTALHIPCLEELLTEVTLSPLSDVSWTSITASHVSCSSQPSLPTLVDGEDMDQASSIQPGQGHPHLDLEEQPGQPTHPPCAEEVASYLEAGSVQQHQQDLEIQLGAPSPPPEVPDVHSRETEMPVTHHKGQDTLEGLTPAAKLERELGLPADVDETPQDVPASAPPSTRRPEERDVMVVPIVQDLPFLAEAVKRQLERHIVKMKVQRRYGLPTTVLEYEKSFEDLVLGHKASQPPPPQRHTGLPYRSPFQQWDRRVRTRKSPGQPPGPQEESADPLDTCPRGTRAPVHTGPAAFLGAAQEMPEEDEETPPYKRERGETACSSSASVETLPGTHGKEQGPGTQGDVHSSSPSDQEERALPESEGAPREQSGQGSESPSTSYGDMGPPELLLEQSVPVGEADHSLEGQSSSSEELGTPELPSALAAPPRSSSPQTQAPSHDERPSALPPSPDSAGTALHIPCLEELLTEVTLSPLSDVSWTSITASHVSCSSQPSLPTLVDGEDMDQASSIQPGQGHPHLDLEEQPGQPTHPPCAEEVASYLEAGSVQQHQQDLEIQLGAPSPPPEVPDVHSRETEMPVTHHKGQDTLEGLTPAAKLERELGLPADVDETPQDVPASAPPSTRRPEERDVMVVPIVQDLPFLAEAVKRQLERHIVKMKVQRRYGLPTTVLEYEKSFEDLVLGHKASQPPPPQRHTALPYRSPFQQWDRRVRTRKSPGQPPGPQEESADPLDTCPRGTRAPAHSGPAAFLGAAQEMPEEDEETPPYKRERGETACSSSASVETLPGTHGKEQGPGTQGDVHSSSPSDQEERALPESEGAPREQSGQGSESPSTSYGDMGPPELLLEQSVPVGEADHSLEGQSSSSEELGTPELPSALAAPPRSSSPQTQAPSHDERPSALPPSPDSAGTALHIPCLEELLTEVTLSPLSDVSWTSITASHVSCSSQPSLPTLVDGEDMDQASSIQPGQGHPHLDLEEQPGQPTHPPCAEEVASYLEAGSVQQHQQDLEIQLGAPSPPPEVPDVHSRETEMPVTHHKGQDTLEGLTPAAKLERELGLPADVDETPQDVPASAPPSTRRPEERDVMVVPIVQDLPFLAEAVKRQLERHIVKMKVQRRYGLPTTVLEYEKSFEDLVLGHKASQPPPPQRHTGLPYRSPFQQWDRRVRTRKSPGQPPGPQEESADPLDTCPRGTRAPVHSGPAAFLGAAQEMPEEDEETPPYKRERGETACSSSASVETLPGTHGKEQGPGTQGDVHSSSPSDQEERALPESEGAPREQSGQGSESPSTSYGDMGPPELLLEQSVPVGEADHSLEGQSSSSEELGTPELPSALAAPPRSSSPQTQAPSHDERPSALPPSPDSAGTALHIPCLEELLTEVTLSPLSDVSWTSITASHVSCSSQPSLPTLVDGEDMDQASSIQPGQGHPHLDLEEQPGQPTHPPCAEEVASYLEAGSVQQHQQDLEIQLGAPSPPPEVPDVHSRETEMPVTHHKGQDTLEGLTPAAKLERELGLPADVDETPQDVPASAPPSTRRPEERDVMVVPIVQDLPFLAEAVKRQLERHIVKMKVQRRYGLPTTVLEYEKSFEDLVLGHKASQPPPPQRHTGLPYRSPFQQWDRRVRTRKSPGQPPGPQEESADPLDTCPRGTRAPVLTGPAAFLGAAQEMPEEDEETPPYKRERGETACSSSASVETLPGTHGKEQGPGTQGDVHSSSPSDQEERALPESEGAPREQSGQGSESPSTSYGDMGPPELLLEQSVPVGEADHSLEGQSSSSEELGTPELPSALAAPPRSSSPQTQAPSHDERPSALPPSPDSAGTALHIPCLEELLTEVTLSPLSDVSWTSITASHVSCSSQPSLPTLVDGEDMDQASSIQPGQGHPHLDLEEQPGQPTHPPCAEEVASYLEAGSVQQHQQDLEIQLGAPSPPPEVPDVHSRETEMPVTHHKGQDTLEGLTPAAKLERELGLPADVDETPQDVPASAPPSTRRPEERDVMVVPIVQDLPFLAEAVKRQLERHIVKMKVQRRYGLPTTVLEYEKSFEDLVLGHKASQPPPPQRHTGLPYRSPFQQWDRRVRTRKSPGQPPGPPEESADPLDTCPRGTRAPVHTGPAAFLGAAQEMPEEDEETPPYKRERGETACSSSASVETLPGTHGKEQGPGTQGDVHSSSPSDQEERALPESEGAPREQSGQGSESPSTSYGDMGPPELLLEQSVPVGEADHSLEGQSSSSEELGTPELPSALAAPPRSSSPQTQAPSHDERPSALPPSPDSAGTALHIPCLEELLTEVTLSPLSDVSWTSITASHVSCSSQPSLPTLVDGEDMDQASSIQPGQGHPHLDLEEQPGQPTHPPCAEEVASYLEAGSVQQHQQDLEIQLGAPSPPPEVPDVHSRETEMPVTHHKGQDTLEGLTPAAKLERELGLPADVDETPQDVPASAPPSTRRPEERDVMVVPIVQDLPFLAEAVKRQLERHIVKMKVQRRYGLPTTVLEYEKSFEDLVLGHKASQPPPPQRHTGLPYRSPFQQWDRRVRTRKSPGQPPGPQEESADPLDTCPRGTRAPVHTGPAAFLGAAQEMPEEDEETPPYKRERGETACSSSASVETLPGTHGKEQGPGTQGDVHSSSPSDQEERALPESEGAPREQSGQGSESPSTSYGDMGPPELLLEQSVPVGEADHSLEGQSSSSEELGTPELPSALAAPPRSSSPQTQAPSHDERPSALPPSPDSAGTALHIPCLEELLTEVTLSPLSDVSWTSITASHVSCSSQPSLPTLVDGEDMDQASSIQPGQGHPHLDLEEQPGQPTHPPCAEEVASYLEAGSVQQHQQDLEIQLGAPSPPPEVPDVHSRETEMPVTHHKGQDTLEGLTPAAKLERELGLPADVDETPQDVPASAPPSTRRPEERDVMVVPIVQDLPFLAEAVKRQLERHIVKMKVQRRYGLPTTVLEYEKSFEDLVLGHKASQPPPPQRHTGLPYRSPFQQWDRRVRTRKSPGQPPGPQEESADPLDTCPRGTRAPVHTGPAAFLGAAQEMPEEDEETPPYKRERGETACSSSASVETLPGTHGKEQGPGTQGDVHSSSPSDQEERALPESEGAPREQSGQGSESPSTSYGDMGPPELLLEQSVPMGEADHSLEGQSSSSEELGTPELPSALAAPPRSSSPQTQAPSHDERPSALPPSPDPAGTALHIPCLEDFITALTDCSRARQANQDLQNQLLALRLEHATDNAGRPKTDLAAELPGALQSHGHRGAEKGKGSTQHRAGSRTLCPKDSKDPRYSLPGKRGLPGLDSI